MIPPKLLYDKIRLSKNRERKRRVEQKIIKGDRLNDQNGGHSPHKGSVQRFVAEKIHPCDASDAAADHGDEEKGGFRDAPRLTPRPAFVDSHCGKACDIYNNGIECQNQYNVHVK